MLMKRGLSTLLERETEAGIYKQRQADIAQAVREHSSDGFLFYNEVSRGSDIAYLTHATQYWVDSMTLVDVTGRTTLIVSLSPRSESWFRETGVFDDIVHVPSLAVGLAAVLRDRGINNVGVADMGYVPHAIVAHLASDSELRVVDVGPALTSLRALPTVSALDKLHACAQLGRSALSRAVDEASTADATSQAALLEYYIRRGGAWDARVSIHDADNGRIIDMACQVADAWYRAERTILTTNDVFERAANQVLADVRAGVTQQQLLSRAREVFAPEFQDRIEVDLVPSPQIEFRRRLASGWAAASFPSGASVYVGLRLRTDGGRIVYATGDTRILNADSARLVSEQEA